MIPRFRPELGLAEVLAALRPSSVEDVARFETAFATEMGQRHAIAFPYGRTGLMLLLEALGLSGKEIICPAYTCVVVPHAIVKSGNRPLFVDSRESDCNMDLDLAEAAIGPNTGALIATSIFGHPVDLDRLDVITARHPNLVIIQDCAHSYAAEWRGRPVQQAGRASIFGINISKTATSIFGGMVTTDDADLATRLRELRKKTPDAGALAEEPCAYVISPRRHDRLSACDLQSRAATRAWWMAGPLLPLLRRGRDRFAG
jgi:dTDP-4-amino-4,6-dideoxygalactose transaminase